MLAPWLWVKQQNCPAKPNPTQKDLSSRWGAFTISRHYWFQMKSCLFWFLTRNLFSKQNETCFIWNQYCHLVDHGSPLPKFSLAIVAFFPGLNTTIAGLGLLVSSFEFLSARFNFCSSQLWPDIIHLNYVWCQRTQKRMENYKSLATLL